MPAIEAWRLGRSHIGDRVVRAGDLVMPEVCVLPIGWTPALHCCQSVLQHAIERAGIDDAQVIKDQSVCFPLNCKDDVVVAGYVDNFAALGPSESHVNGTRDKMWDVLVNDFHLPVHAEEKC